MFRAENKWKIFENYIGSREKKHENSLFQVVYLVSFKSMNLFDLQGSQSYVQFCNAIMVTYPIWG